MDCAFTRSQGAIRSATPVYSGRCWLAALACALMLTAFASGAAVKKKPAKRVLDPPIDLNTASPRDLQSLPGIGASTAKRIIAGRPYSSVTDLASVGVSRRTISAITPMVTASGNSRATKAAAKPLSSSPSTPGMVWVNLDTKRYHKEGSRWFGNTSNGKYMTEEDAQHAGYRSAKE